MEKISKWKLISIDIDAIEIEKSQFNWFPASLSESVCNSIIKNGIRFPIIVNEVKKSEYILIDGFKRLNFIKSSANYLQKNNLSKNISCLVIPRKVKFFELVMIRFETFSSDEINFPGFQVCSLIKILSKKGLPNHEIIKNVLPRLGLESSSRLANQLIKMADFFEKLEKDRTYKLSNFLRSLSCKDLVLLQKFSDKEILSLLKFISKMEVKGKKLHNMLKELNEICRIRGNSVMEILEMRQFKEILTKKNLQISERYRLLRQHLNISRYPQLNSLREKFAQRRKSLNLPQRISLNCDNFFEEDDLILMLQFSSLKELKKHLTYLESISTDKGNKDNISLWEDIFYLLK